MKIINENKVDRNLIDFNGIKLIRIKTYNSDNKESNIKWYFEKDKIIVKNQFYNKLENKLFKLKRKNATIIR